MLVKLKIAIVGSRKSQRRIAADCNIPENRFSSIVHEWTTPREHERRAIAAALGKPAEELFTADEWVLPPATGARRTSVADD